MAKGTAGINQVAPVAAEDEALEVATSNRHDNEMKPLAAAPGDKCSHTEGEGKVI